jgi:TatA/E family protein of Tat protein translocase
MVLAEIFGPDAIVVIVLAVVLLFGADRLPKLIRSLGEASRELKGGATSDADQAPTTDGDTVTLTKVELDALLAERGAQPGKEPF